MTEKKPYLAARTVQSLSKWLNPHHLSETAIAQARAQLNASEISLLVIDDFLREDRITALHTSITCCANFERRYALYKYSKSDNSEKTNRTTHRVNREQYLGAHDSERFYRYSALADLQREPENPANLILLRFKNMLEEISFINYFSTLTEIALDRAQSQYVNRYGCGDYLKPHDDRGPGRRLAYLIYLSKNWSADDGGQLVLTPANDHTERLSIEYRYNRLVLFDVTKHHKHEVTTVLTDGKERDSIGGWYGP